MPEYSTLGHAQLPKACNFGTEAIQRSGDVHLLVNACRGYDTHVIQEKHRNIYPLWCFFCAFKTHGDAFIVCLSCVCDASGGADESAPPFFIVQKSLDLHSWKYEPVTVVYFATHDILLPDNGSICNYIELWLKINISLKSSKNIDE